MQSRQKKGNKEQSRDQWNRKQKNNKVNEHKSIFLEETNKMDKLLARLSWPGTEFYDFYNFKMQSIKHS